ncbi:MAG: VPLPA-CTERM sorting domain-containing protein [Paracoccaceae bacterium]
MLRQFALSGAFAVMFAGLAHAATVSGNFSGTIDAPSGATSTLVATGQGTNSLAWGTPTHTATQVQAGNSSSLTVNNSAFSTNAATTGVTKILFGTITWNNQSNWKTGGSWTSNVNFNIDFSAPSNPVSLGQSVGFSIVNTTDISGNTTTNETTGLNPDKISSLLLSSTAFGVPVSLGQGLVLTSVFFGLENAGTAGTQTAVSSYDAATGQWINREGGTSTIGIYGNVSAVPLPAGVWLMLGGLGGLAALRRRSRKAA